MTPEDWQRAWQESGEAVKNLDIDVFGRGYTVLHESQHWRGYFFIGPFFALSAGFQVVMYRDLLSWIQAGGMLGMGVMLVRQGFTLRRIARHEIRPGMTAVSYCRELLELQRRGLRAAFPMLLVLPFAIGPSTWRLIPIPVVAGAAVLSVMVLVIWGLRVRNRRIVRELRELEHA